MGSPTESSVSSNATISSVFLLIIIVSLKKPRFSLCVTRRYSLRTAGVIPVPSGTRSIATSSQLVPERLPLMGASWELILLNMVVNSGPPPSANAAAMPSHPLKSSCSLSRRNDMAATMLCVYL